MPRGRRPKPPSDEHATVSSLGVLLRELREARLRANTPGEKAEHAFTVVWIAPRLHVNRGTYLAWELGTAVPGSRQLREFADLLGLGPEEEARLFVQWTAAQIEEASRQIVRRSFTRAEVERAALAALAALVGSQVQGGRAAQAEASRPPALVHRDWPDPLLLEQFLFDARYHIVNAASHADRVLAEHHLGVVERAAGGRGDPTYRRLLAWAAQLRASHLLEVGSADQAAARFQEAFELAHDLPAARSPEGAAASRGNLLLSARYGMAAAGLAAGDGTQAAGHLRWWLDNQSLLVDPGPHIWLSAVYRSTIDTLVRLRSLDGAAAAFEEAAGRFSGRSTFDQLTPDARMLMLDSHARLLAIRGDEATARDQLLRLLAEVAGGAEQVAGGMAARWRVEIRLIESLLTRTPVSAAEWARWAERALFLDGRAGFPKSIRRIRARDPVRWDALAKELGANSAGESGSGVTPSAPLPALLHAPAPFEQLIDFQALLRALAARHRGAP